MTAMLHKHTRLTASLAVALSTAILSGPALANHHNDDGKRALELTDIMKFREIEQRALSANGEWLAYAAVPDLGDSTGYVVNTLNAQRFSVERGDRPMISDDGRYVVFRQQASLLEREQADMDSDQETPAVNAVLLDTRTGQQQVFEAVDSFYLTAAGNALALLRSDDDNGDGQTLEVEYLQADQQQRFAQVTAVERAPEGGRLAITLQDNGEDNDNARHRLIVLNTKNQSQLTLHDSDTEQVNSVSFNTSGDALAFLTGPANSSNPQPGQQLQVWQYGEQSARVMDTEKDGWVLSAHHSPRWSEDGERLFVGHRPAEPDPEEPRGKPESDEDLYDLERIVSDRRLQVWHGDDERIVTHQRESHRMMTQATAPAVVWLDEQRMVSLGDDIEDNLRVSEHRHAQLVSNARPHLREISWNGFYQDIDHVNLDTGERQNVVERVRSGEAGHLSADGRYVAYVQDEQYRVFDSSSGAHQTLATDVTVSWVDEENDRPMEARSYGVAGWLDDNSAFLAYDRYDIWKISLDGEAVNLTNTGREQEKQFRVVPLGDDLAFATDQTLLVHSYSDPEKYHGFYQLDLASAELNVLIEDNKRYAFVDYAEDVERILFTEEDFRQFPDIWAAPKDFSERRQLTEVNPQVDDFKWGDPSLIEWQTEDGDSLQGIVIKPDNYDASRTYPVMVYYYEQFSQRLYHFNQMKVNHRPNFPFYVGQDYVVFLPDIRFRPGAPGPSATESLVPGVQKLIDEGIADADRIGLHGHSWSGYQSAFVVTETDMFAAVVSGAPVSNMTSAYTGIRWQTGLSRQFQYETGQSRLGVSMYEDLDPYIKNSPVFFADKINTPMLIQFGDADGAVPWEQGIEYYLALRRLDKDVVMLHYEDEPHHLQQYANKVDYSIKMLEFFDHYLKDKEAPDWWQEGMPYQPYE